MKLRGFGRAFLLGCLAVCGLEAFASGGVDGLPNLIEGGYVYAYDSPDGNTTANPANIYGRIPHQVEDFQPPTDGRTNVIYLARTESFTVSKEWTFCGWSGYGNAVELPSTNATGSAFLRCLDDREHYLFKVMNYVPYLPDGRYGPNFSALCYFTNNVTGACGCLQVYLVSRSDAFYRIPRQQDTYYVRTGTTLDFVKFDGYKGSDWKMDGDGKWDLERASGTTHYDRFTIKSGSTEDPIHLKTEDGSVDITVHVVANNFEFKSYILYLNGTEGTRTLSDILFETGLGYSIADVASVRAVDDVRGVSVAGPDQMGDYVLKAEGLHDFDRLVVVTLTGERGVILLKLTSLTGRCDETLCASKAPVILPGDFQNLLRDDNGNELEHLKWQKTDKIDNAPPGYTNVWFTPNCVLYDGKRYSVYITSKSDDFVYNSDTPKGQLACVRQLRKIIAWLEDSEGNLFASPAVCIGNAAFKQRHAWRFCMGTSGCLYTNASINDPVDTWENEKYMWLSPYIGMYLPGSTQSEEEQLTDGCFQGVTPDIYGYCAVLACAESGAELEFPDIDEMSVFLISNVKTVTVKKDVIGDIASKTFAFRAIFTNNAGNLATNWFSLANHESFSFVVKTGGVVSVTEILPANVNAYEIYARKDGPRNFMKTNVLTAANVTSDQFFEFRNVGITESNVKSLWITDHCDAGDGKIHLAFEPTFNPPVDLSSWIDLAFQSNAIHVACSENADDIASSGKVQDVGYPPGLVKRDVDKNWVWITADTSAMTNRQDLYWKILIDNLGRYVAYADDVLSSSVPIGAGQCTNFTKDVSAYVFSRADEATEIQMNRTSRIKEVLLVGGGGAGGGSMGGGGGGGGVSLISSQDLDQDGAVKAGDALWLDIGAGGARIYEERAPLTNTSSFVNASTGLNGEPTVLAIGNTTYSVLGGGGGGSYSSTFPGKVNPVGSGRSGACGGGGSSTSGTGGSAVTGMGCAGGNASTAAGGGGGMREGGATGVNSWSNKQSGRGGAGLAFNLTGTSVVYGSGGGGGGGRANNTIIKNGAGGENAGDGGANGEVGHDAPAGFGGGGGGGGQDGTYGYRGGAGGSGAIVVVFQNASVIDADCELENVTPVSATISAKLKSFPGGASSASAKVRYWKVSAPDRVFESDETFGITIDNPEAHVYLDQVESSTEYAYEAVLTDSNGLTLVLPGANFTTQALHFNRGYEDKYLVLSANADSKAVTRTDDGDYLLNFTNGVTDVYAMLKRPMAFARYLVVGGGGAGGNFIGGGGGGGQVLENEKTFEDVQLAEGSEIRLSVGAGGTVQYNSSSPEKSTSSNGGSSTLQVSALGLNRTAIGGGAGGSNDASNNRRRGQNGANGGGGVGSSTSGTGGTSTSIPRGYAGGRGAKRTNAGGQDEVAGGGGGAAENGHDGRQGTGGSDFAGDGGRGVSSDITGEEVVYGSGGGGGNTDAITPGKGGPGAGDGGCMHGLGFNVPDVAHPGMPGRGGGGGGGCYSGDSTKTVGGAGGSGAVIIRLRVKDAPIDGSAKVSATSKGAALVTGKVASLGNGVEEVEAVYYAVEPVTAPKKLMLAAANVDPKYTKLEGVGPLKVGDTFDFKITGLVAGTQYKYTLLFVSGDIQQTVNGRFETRATTEPVAVNEFMASNGDSLVTANGKDGLDWIELRNDGDVAENVSGWYLSDNPDKAESKWKKIEGNAVVPAHGTLIVWADKDYESFTAAEPFVRTGLGKDGGSVFLANPFGEVLSRVDYPEQIKNISYGIDTSGQAGYFNPATPGVANGGNALNLPTPAVAFDVPHGYKTEAFDVGISCPSDANAEIHYTTDGSKPTSTSPLYTDRIAVDRTTCLRAAVVDENSVLQNDASATYIFLDDVLQQSTATPAGFPASGAVNGHKMVYGMNPDVVNGPDRERLLRGFTNSIATISFVIDPKALFDKETGIYVHSENVNSGKAWERPVLVEQIDPVRGTDNEFSAVAGLRLRGGNSRDNKYVKHAFRLFFRGEYGMSKLKFPLFGDEGADEFDKVDLRCSQNYSWASEDSTDDTFVHEVFSRDTQRDTGVHYTRSRYYHLYINGLYWGLYQTQERGEENFAETYNGGKADDYDVIKTDDQGAYKPTEASAGTLEAWSNLWRIAVSEGVEGERAANYQRLLGCNPDGTRNPDYPVLLNPANLASYMVNAHYVVDADTPAAGTNPNNLYCLRDRKDGKAKEDGFFFLRHDAEHSMGTTKCLDGSARRTSCKVTDDPTARGTELQSSIWKEFEYFSPAELNYALLKHPDYKMLFADVFYRTCLKPGGALTVEKATERFRARMTEIDDAIVCESARWARKGQTRQTWLDACGECLWFITNRMPYMVTQYRNRGWYPSIDAPTVTIADGKATFTAANPVYYTLDGSDPRTNGTLAPAEGVTLPATGTTVIRARCKSASGEWSALDEAKVDL